MLLAIVCSSRSLTWIRYVSCWAGYETSEPYPGSNCAPARPAGQRLSSVFVAVRTGREYGLFINGARAEPAAGELRDLTEPASGEPLGRAAMAGEADVDRAVEAARAAVDGPWGRTPPNERSRLLHALADAIAANRKEL